MNYQSVFLGQFKTLLRHHQPLGLVSCYFSWFFFYIRFIFTTVWSFYLDVIQGLNSKFPKQNSLFYVSCSPIPILLFLQLKHYDPLISFSFLLLPTVIQSHGTIYVHIGFCMFFSILKISAYFKSILFSYQNYSNTFLIKLLLSNTFSFGSMFYPAPRILSLKHKSVFALMYLRNLEDYYIDVSFSHLTINTRAQ